MLPANPVSVEYKLTPEYVAGFFDGEGSIGIYPRSYNRKKTIRYFVLVVSLAQSGNIGKQILDHLASVFGGSVYENKSNQIHKKQMWKWNVSADKAFQFLMWFKNYTTIKSKEIDLGLQFQILDNKRFDNEEAIQLVNEVKDCKSIESSYGS